MAFIPGKTNWTAADTVNSQDFNRIEGNTDDLNSQIDTEEAARVAHVNDVGAVHGATAAATANTNMRRDAAGRAKVVAPNASDDIARKDTVDAVQTNLTTHTNDVGAVHGATSANTSNTNMRRDANGRAQVGFPAADGDIATKAYGDQLGSTGPVANTIMRRDVNGRSSISEPLNNSDIASKFYVDQKIEYQRLTASGTLAFDIIEVGSILFVIRAIEGILTTPATGSYLVASGPATGIYGSSATIANSTGPWIIYRIG